MAESPDRGRPPEHRFIVPDLAGPSTGGTVYNRELVAALGARGAAVDVLDVAAAERALRASEAGTYWLDTLFLEAVPKLVPLLGPAQRLGLIAHYLPALVRHGAGIGRAELSPAEATALDLASVFLAPSDFMRETLLRLGIGGRDVVVVEPGRLARGLAPLPLGSGVLRALVVAHLVAGKGVDRLLSALATSTAPDDRFTLEVIGSVNVDAAHAEACRGFAAAPTLCERVTLTGELTPAAVNERLAACDLLLSASSMESFGMALAEARTLGVPIVARAGGNVERLVTDTSGGELVADATSVANACLALARNPSELDVRRERARKAALPARPWSAAAREFLEQSP
jgi:glycosyltransferase involved in cell wall biosynthesis